MKKLLTTAALISFIGTPALVMAADKVDIQKDAQEFVTKASVSSMFEIESSKIAAQKSTNPEVKALAEKMIADHTKASNDLKAAVGKSGLKLVPAKALDEDHREKLKELKEAKATDFDDKYIDIQEDAHESAVSLFEDYINKDAKDSNASLKTFASNTLPTLQHHKTEVETLDEAM